MGIKSSKIQILSRKKDLKASHSAPQRRSFITNSRPWVPSGQEAKYRREEEKKTNSSDETWLLIPTGYVLNASENNTGAKAVSHGRGTGFGERRRNTLGS